MTLIPPEAPFSTTNGLSWILKHHGKQLCHLQEGPTELPVYSQLGCGQFGRVFEVLPAPPLAAASFGADAAAADATAVAAAGGATTAAAAVGDVSAGGKESVVSGNVIAEVVPRDSAAAAAAAAAASLPPGQRYAAKLLPLANFTSEGATADLLREFSLYGELDTPLDPQQQQQQGFANVLRVFGVTSCVSFSKPFAEAYLSSVQTAGVLVVEMCASDLAAFARLLYAQGKLTHSALKFYAWQLLNGLARLHGRGVVHRDLKPENILVAAAPISVGQQLLKEGVAILKVADLGMARKMRSKLGQEPAGTCASSLPRRDEASLQQQQQQQQQQRKKQQQQQDFRLLCMRQSGRVVTLPYRPPEILSASAANQSAAKLPVASYSSSCDIWSLGVILLELCLPQNCPKPHRWNFAFVLHAVERAAFQMEFMVLDNILKVLGRPREEELLRDMTRLAGEQRDDLLSFIRAFPSLSHGERKMAILDFILERGGLHLDALGLDLLARLLHVSPSRRLSAHCALAHPWFHDLPFDQMNRLGLTFHLSDLSIPALRASLPSPLRRCLTSWEARGRSPSSTRFACHALLQQALHQQQQQVQQQQRALPGGPAGAQLKGFVGGAPAAGAAAGSERQQQKQQQQQQHLTSAAVAACRRSGDCNRRSGSSMSVQRLRSNSIGKGSAAPAAGHQQQLQQHQGSSSLGSRPGSVKSLRSSESSSSSSAAAAAGSRRSNSSINRRSDSVPPEQRRKVSDAGGPPGAPPSVLRQKEPTEGGLPKGPPSGGPPCMLRQREKQKEPPFRPNSSGRRAQCAGSDDEVASSKQEIIH